MFAQEPALFLGGSRVCVELRYKFFGALALFRKRLPYRLDLGHERRVVGYYLAYITLRRLYLPALCQRCVGERR